MTSIRDDDDVSPFCFFFCFCSTLVEPTPFSLKEYTKHTESFSDTLAMVNQLKEKKEQVQRQQNLDPENPATESSRIFFCGSFCSALSRLFSLTCVIFLVLSFATLLSAIFWLFPPRRSLPRHHADHIVHHNGKPLFQHKVYLFCSEGGDFKVQKLSLVLYIELEP